MEKMWVIINIADAYQALGGSMLPKDSRPKFIHNDEKRAQWQLLRLQKMYPSHEFALFESIATAQPLESNKDVLFIEMMQPNIS